MYKVAAGIKKELNDTVVKIVTFHFEVRNSKHNSETIKIEIVNFLDDLNRLCMDIEDFADSYGGVDRTAVSIDTEELYSKWESCAHALYCIELPGQ